MSGIGSFKTHDVLNQPNSLSNYNAWKSDIPLREAIALYGADWAADHLSDYGSHVGGELIRLGFTANENPPELHSFDGYGRRIDEVEFHPAYHEIMSQAMRYGMHNFAWRHVNHEGAHVARAAVMYLGVQADAGTCCPMSMMYAAVPALRHAPELAELWIPKLIAPQYDPRSVPMHEKASCTIGMGMTEKQGGSDVRTNTTRAESQSDGSYAIVGHKWFFSAPMSDAHLILAQSEGGLSCFLMPRFLPDGTRNQVVIQRLKNKLGDWSNASAEVEFQRATATLVGQEGRGIVTILEMVSLTRMDCMTSSSGLMRQALVQALHHTRQREAFGKRLINQPLMRNVLADLALESEAAVALTMRIARAIDRAASDPHEAALARIGTAIGKYWICKRTPQMINEAQECLGGIGYVEETIMPRLYRQAPLNSIWEGSGNVQCLDVLRAMHKEPETRKALLAELNWESGKNPWYDQELESLSTQLDTAQTPEFRCRYLVERLAIMLQASALLQTEEKNIAQTFCVSRLGQEHGFTFGTLGIDAALSRLLERAMVSVSS